MRIIRRHIVKSTDNIDYTEYQFSSAANFKASDDNLDVSHFEPILNIYDDKKIQRMIDSTDIKFSNEKNISVHFDVLFSCGYRALKIYKNGNDLKIHVPHYDKDLFSDSVNDNVHPIYACYLRVTTIKNVTKPVMRKTKK